MLKLLSDSLATTLLYLVLVGFAIYGILYLAPAIARTLGQTTEKATQVDRGRIRL